MSSSWERQAYHDKGEMSPYIGDVYYERRLAYGQVSDSTSSENEIKGKLTFGKKISLPQRIARMFGAIEVQPMVKLDEYEEARQRKFADWLQKAIDEQKTIEWIEKLFILKSDKDLKQLKDALFFLSENISIKGELGYGEIMKGYVETINRIEDLIKQRQMAASEGEALRKEIIKEIISLPEENGLRRKVIELTAVLNSL